MKMMIMIMIIIIVVVVISEYHVHYHNNTMQGHINIVGNGTSLNNQLPAQGYEP